jgi:hypothetical protein
MPLCGIREPVTNRIPVFLVVEILLFILTGRSLILYSVVISIVGLSGITGVP